MTARRGGALHPKNKAECGCEWLQVSDSLWLCPHNAYGRAQYYAGAVDEARRMMALAGGYEVLLRQKLDKKRTRRPSRASVSTDDALAQPVLGPDGS